MWGALAGLGVAAGKYLYDQNKATATGLSPVAPVEQANPLFAQQPGGALGQYEAVQAQPVPAEMMATPKQQAADIAEAERLRAEQMRGNIPANAQPTRYY